MSDSATPNSHLARSDSTKLDSTRSESNLVKPELIKVKSETEPFSEPFSREYVHGLREENKTYRLRTQEAERLRQESEQKASERVQAAQANLVRAELKAVALAAGMIDLDGLKLADLSSVTLNDAGEVQGAQVLIQGLQEAKPYLFRATSNSSNPNPPPPAKPVAAKRATHMSRDEYEKAKQTAMKIAR